MGSLVPCVGAKLWLTLANGPDNPVPKLTPAPQLLSLVGKTPLYLFYPLQTNNATHQNLNCDKT